MSDLLLNFSFTTTEFMFYIKTAHKIMFMKYDAFLQIELYLSLYIKASMIIQCYTKADILLYYDYVYF